MAYKYHITNKNYFIWIHSFPLSTLHKNWSKFIGSCFCYQNLTKSFCQRYTISRVLQTVITKKYKIDMFQELFSAFIDITFNNIYFQVKPCWTIKAFVGFRHIFVHCCKFNLSLSTLVCIVYFKYLIICGKLYKSIFSIIKG